MRVLTLILLALAVPAGADTDNLQPVEVGRSFRLASGTGEARMAQETQTQLLPNGVTAIRRENVDSRPGGVEDKYWNFWTQDSAGSTYLHGFYVKQSDFGVTYNPPVLWTQSNVEVGTDWGTVFEAVSFTGIAQGISAVSFEVTTLAPLTVPVGTFDAVRVIWGTPAGSKAAIFGEYDLLGRRSSAGKSALTEVQWFSNDIGLVQEELTGVPVIRLTELTTISTVRSSWGAVKATF